MTGYWSTLARQHWQRYLPERYAVLKDPGAFFGAIEEDATERYAAVREAHLAGASPNNGTMTWPEFLDRLAWANQTAREIVETELIYIPGNTTSVVTRRLEEAGLAAKGPSR
jgi:hypothetical protein